MRRAVLQRKRRKESLATGRELIAMFPNLREVMSEEIVGYSGKRRKYRKRSILEKIGAEGKIIFNLQTGTS